MPDASGIAEETALALFGAAFPGQQAAVSGCIKGSINQIFRIETAEGQFALRVRYNESRFQYEKGVFKEVLAALLLPAREANPGAFLDAEIERCWRKLAGRCSGEWVAFPCGAGIFHFDFTGARYPGPWAVLEWTGDALGARFDTASAFHVGQLVSQIHRVRFQNGYGNLHHAHLGGVDIPRQWKDEIIRRNWNTGGAFASAEALARKLQRLCAASYEAAREFVLCHNDLHCLNVTQANGALRLVDWDNAQIAPKELDFVKPAHWSMLAADGHFAPDAGVFSSFCAGYGAAPEVILASPVFKLAELLWLFRVLEFAGGLEGPAAPPFWPAQRYAALLRERLAVAA
jgi:Phosphotransferase enzyme family